jgi:hypothetical protein
LDISAAFFGGGRGEGPLPLRYSQDAYFGQVACLVGDRLSGGMSLQGTTQRGILVEQSTFKISLFPRDNREFAPLYCSS